MSRKTETLIIVFSFASALILNILNVSMTYFSKGSNFLEMASISQFGYGALLWENNPTMAILSGLLTLLGSLIFMIKVTRPATIS